MKIMTNERRIRCGKETEYNKFTPIKTRLNYVEGSGQFCRKCWRMLYPTSDYSDSDIDLQPYQCVE